MENSELVSSPKVVSPETLRSYLRRDFYDLVDDLNKRLKGELLTLIESFGGDSQVIKSRKDVLHLILKMHYEIVEREFSTKLISLNRWLSEYIASNKLEDKTVNIQQTNIYDHIEKL